MFKNIYKSIFYLNFSQKSVFLSIFNSIFFIAISVALIIKLVKSICLSSKDKIIFSTQDNESVLAKVSLNFCEPIFFFIFWAAYLSSSSSAFLSFAFYLASSSSFLSSSFIIFNFFRFFASSLSTGAKYLFSSF